MRSQAARTATVQLPNTGLRATLIFIVLVLVFELALGLAVPLAARESLCVATTNAAGALIGGTGIPVSVFGTQIFLPSRMLGINLECTGIYLIGAYAALVLVSAASLSRKAIGLLAGTVAILAANLVRLVLVAQISENWPSVFNFTHDLLFQVLLVVWVFVVWGAWVLWVRRDAG